MSLWFAAKSRHFVGNSLFWRYFDRLNKHPEGTRQTAQVTMCCCDTAGLVCHSLSFRRDLELRNWCAAPGAQALKLTGHFLCQRKREAQQEACSCFWKMSCPTMSGSSASPCMWGEQRSTCRIGAASLLWMSPIYPELDLAVRF